MTASSVRIATVMVACVVFAATIAGPALVAAADGVLTLRGTAVGTPAKVTIALQRWSTDDERQRIVAALAAPAPTPAPAAAAGGRGGRGGRAGGPPASPMSRLAEALGAAPTVGFIWGEGPTGYSVKYAWQEGAAAGAQRIVIVTDRRLDATGLVPSPEPATDVTFTLLDIRLDAKGTGDARVSPTGVVIAEGADRLGLESGPTAPVVLKVTR